FNMTPDEAAVKIRRLEQLLAANGRKRSEIELAISPYTKRITPDDLKRYRDLGVEELVLVNFRPPRTEEDITNQLENLAREWVEPASKL
ncbi:MAG: hypothetical protein ACREQE_07495, partial [Candidatus Binataceae bacterium]